MSFSIAEISIDKLGLFSVFLLDRTRLGILKSYDKVNLGLGATFIGAKHDRETGLVIERLELEWLFLLLLLEQLDIGTTALERVLEFHLVLDDQWLATSEYERLSKAGGNSVMAST